MTTEQIDKESHERLTKALEGLFASGSISYLPSLTSVHVECCQEDVGLTVRITVRLLGLSGAYGVRIHRDPTYPEKHLISKAEELLIHHLISTLGLDK